MKIFLSVLPTGEKSLYKYNYFLCFPISYRSFISSGLFVFFQSCYEFTQSNRMECESVRKRNNIDYRR